MSVGGLGSASGELLIDISQALANLQTLENRVKGLDSAGSGAFSGTAAGGARLDALGNKLDGVNRRYGDVAKVGLGFGVAVAAGFGLAINSAANFEYAMDAVGASLGGVAVDGGITTEQFEKLNEEALRIGANTTASAGEAASVMETLARSGVSVEEIFGGVAEAAVQVGEATGESFTQSASTLGTMQNLFRDTGITATEMADVTVNAMNASDATMSEFQTGVANMGAVIGATGMDFGEAAGLISFFNAKGMAAARVGSSLTSAYMNLVNPTADMAAAQAEANIAVYDANGAFRGFPAILDDVRTHTEGMTDAQRDAFITQLFGAEALDVVTLALESQDGALEGHIDSMNKQGTAAEASRQRMDNLKGSIEQLKGAIESAMIVIGSIFAPAIRMLADLVAGLVNRFLDLPKGVQTAIAAFIGITGAIVGAASAIVLFGGQAAKIGAQIARLVGGILRIIPALLGLNPIILLIIAAIALLAVAYKTNFLGFADAVNGLARTIGDALGRAAEFIGQFIDRVQAIKSVLDMGGGTGIGNWLKAIGLAAIGAAEAFGPLEGVIRAIGRAFIIAGDFANAFAENFRYFSRNVNPIAAAFKALGATLQGFAHRFGPVEKAIRNLGKGFTSLGKAAGDIGDILQAAFKGDWSEALEELQHMLPNLADGFQNVIAGLIGLSPMSAIAGLFGLIGDAVQDLASQFTGPWASALGNFGEAISSAGDALGGFADAMVALVQGDFGGAFDSLRDAVGDLAGVYTNMGEAAMDALGGAWDALSGVDWGGVLDTIGSGLSGAAGFALDFGEKILTAIQDALPSLDELATMAGTFATDLGSAISTAIEGAKDFAINIGSKLLTEIQDALPKLAELATVAGNFALDLASSIATAIEGAADFAVNIGSKLLAEIRDALPTLGELAAAAEAFAIDLGNSIVRAVEGAADFAVNIGSKLLAEIQDALPTLSELAGVAAQFALDIGQAISDAISNAVDFAINIGKMLLAEISDALPTLAELMAVAVPFAQNIGLAISQGISSAVDFAVNIGRMLLAEISDALPTLAELLGIAGDLAGNLAEAIVSAISSAVDFAVDIGATLLAEISDAIPTIGELAGAAGDFAGNLSSSITTAIGDINWDGAFTGLMTALGTVIEKAKDAFNWVRDTLGFGDDGEQSGAEQAAEAERIAEIMTEAANDHVGAQRRYPGNRRVRYQTRARRG
jgi:TP901 family phage tail tape measure protein